MTSTTPTVAEVQPDPRFEKRTRRRFSAPEKLRLLIEADVLAHGEQDAWLRRNHIYAAQLSGWSKRHASLGLAGLEPHAPRREDTDPRERQTVPHGTLTILVLRDNSAVTANVAESCGCICVAARHAAVTAVAHHDNVGASTGGTSLRDQT